ncbi:putative quinol monooxygenase [uncultured Sphingomonas sp.]|uniref:putative quinol monooxygenase n=1 Tax=uncultured Sphingomonas sp. TaxID=158754 RepID=UPI0035CB1E23
MALTFIAEINLKPDCFDVACRAVGEIVAATRDEAGCERFDAHPMADGSSTLMIYERWANRAAYDFHHAQDYTRAVFKSYEDWLSGPVKMTELADGLV